jgi:3-hydroxymyristoyl/3-hydroxydecanoyl-(acyl carrier protein) dehydratase
MSQPSTLLEPTGIIPIGETFLPHGHMRQVTRVTAVDGPSIRGEVDLDADHWVWDEHFPDDPIFPGTLMIEAAGQLLALWAWANGHRGRPRLVRTSAEFHHPVHPGGPALILIGEVRQKRGVFFGSIRILAGETDVATVEAVLVVLQTGAGDSRTGCGR